MKKKRIFVDSDVIISSLISITGAASYLLNEADLELFISNKSILELEKVSDRLGMDIKKLRNLIKNRFKVVKLESISEEDSDYVLDPNDAHILAGAKKAKARYLISYNIRHFKVEKIKDDFKIMVLTPAKLLQYLRSIQ